MIAYSRAQEIHVHRSRRAVIETAATDPPTEQEPYAPRAGPFAREFSDITRSLRSVSGGINRFAKIKRKYQFDFEEVLLFAACGAINFAAIKEAIPFAQPANISSIAEYVELPRETVRRKLLLMEHKGFVDRYSGGYLIKRLHEWLDVAMYLESATAD
jgi:hypothetical protein